MSTEQKRTDFEESMSCQGEWPQAIERAPDGEYKLAQTAAAWEVWQSAWDAALQSQKPEPSDVMLSGVLRMPYAIAMATEISRLQFYHRAQQALNELEALQAQDREECNWQFDYEESAYQTDCGNLFIIIDGSPGENRMKFCCYCGSKINEVIDHARRAEGGGE